MRDLAVYDPIPTAKLRDYLLDELVRCYSLEAIDMEDFEKRSSLVAKAESRAEMLAQVQDLPVLQPEAEAEKPRQRQASPNQSWKLETGAARQHDAAIAIFSGSESKGVWHSARHISALASFGGIVIDFRKAYIPPEGVMVSCLCLFGGLDIIVPPGIKVSTRGAGIFGGFDRVNCEAEDAQTPEIVVEGLAVFGGISVRIKN